MAGRLTIVGTPIGNLGDVTERARETLASADLVVAEDTRRTGHLLAHLGVERRMLSMFEGNERERVEVILARLRDGAEVALVSDAGMPSVSDPGFRLVRACVEEGIPVSVVPGPSAVTASLAISGLPTDRFAFEGFLPRKAAERRARLRAIADDDRTLVLFESPRRVAETLANVVAELGGDRRVALCRELTKLHEEVLRGTAAEILERMRTGEPPRGEIVLVIEGRAAVPPSIGILVKEAEALVAAGTRKREAASTVASRHGASANEIYAALTGRA